MSSTHRLDTVLTCWEDLHGVEGSPSQTYNALRRTMRALVPEPEADAVAAVEVDDGEKAVLVLHGSSLYIAKTTGAGDDVQVEVRREPLDPARVSVRMTDERGETGPVRTWAFERDGRPFLSMRTKTIRRGFDDTPDNEPFAFALCRAVGWDVPGE